MFYEFYALADEKLQRSVALLPWRHNLLIISKTNSLDEARFYTEQAIEMGWSSDILLNFIKAETYKNSKILPKQHNFEKALPEHLQEQADRNIKKHLQFGVSGIKPPVKAGVEKDWSKKSNSFYWN